MTSIRRHLLAWLLPGFFLLWVVAGAATYFVTLKRYEVETDAKLPELLGALPFTDEAAGGGMIGFEDFVKDDFGIYFQIHDAKGERILKSESLDWSSF